MGIRAFFELSVSCSARLCRVCDPWRDVPISNAESPSPRSEMSMDFLDPLLYLEQFLRLQMRRCETDEKVRSTVQLCCLIEMRPLDRALLMKCTWNTMIWKRMRPMMSRCEAK